MWVVDLPEWDRVEDVETSGGKVVKIMVLNVVDDSLHLLNSDAAGPIRKTVKDRQLVYESGL